MDPRLESLATEHTCFTCKAGWGEWCRTRSGRLAGWLHADRINPILQAYGLGYSDGRQM